MKRGNAFARNTQGYCETRALQPNPLPSSEAQPVQQRAGTAGLGIYTTETHPPLGYPRRRYFHVDNFPVKSHRRPKLLNPTSASCFRCMCATVPAEAKAILGDRFCAGGVLGTGNSFHVDSFALRIGACVQDGGCIQRVPRGQDHAHLGGRQAWVRKRKPGVLRTLY